MDYIIFKNSLTIEKKVVSVQKRCVSAIKIMENNVWSWI